MSPGHMKFVSFCYRNQHLPSGGRTADTLLVIVSHENICVDVQERARLTFWLSACRHGARSVTWHNNSASRFRAHK